MVQAAGPDQKGEEARGQEIYVGVRLVWYRGNDRRVGATVGFLLSVDHCGRMCFVGGQIGKEGPGLECRLAVESRGGTGTNTSYTTRREWGDGCDGGGRRASPTILG